MKRTKRTMGMMTFISASILFLLSCRSSNSPSSAWRTNLPEQIKTYLQDAFVPGISIAVIEKGRISWQGAFGVKNAETGEPVTETTVFEAASMSKPVFSYGVLKLVDKGMLDLDKPLADYLAGADLKSIYPPVASASDARWKKITARMVLTHRTGFPNWFGRSSLRFVYDPGQRFSYSGEGFSLLGAAVIVITGRSLNEFIQELVFDPLQMKASSFVWRPDYDASFTASHDMLGQRTNRSKATQFLPGASLYSTAADYARFLIALGSGAGLSKQTWQEMTQSQVEVTGRDEKPCFTWGLGVGINQPEKDVTTLWHWGDNGDLKSYFEIIPKQRRGVVFFMNGTNGHAITPLLTQRILGIGKPAMATSYFDYDTLNSSMMALLRAYRSGGITEARKVVAADPANLIAENSPEIQRLTSLAGMAVRIGDVPGARAAIDFILQYQPASIRALIISGGIHLLKGHPDAMEASFQKALHAAQNAKDSIVALRLAESAINSLGYSFLNKSQFEMAITVLKYNVSSFPKSANTYDSLGEAYWKSGNKKLAIDNYKKALELEPNLQTAKNALVELMK
jgi:CubicO group peptidase (beta-lactamase class C family)